MPIAQLGRLQVPTRCFSHLPQLLLNPSSREKEHVGLSALNLPGAAERRPEISSPES